MSYILSNGDSSSEDDDVFIKSKLDMMIDGVKTDDDYLQGDLATSDYVFCDKDLVNVSPFTPLSTPSPKREQNAVIFSVNFGGKHFGELGLFEPDISILDWNGFKSYLFTSLNLEYSEDCAITYSDEDGDKIPIDTEVEYQEALRVAKHKSSNGEKVILNITRLKGFPYNSLRSLVSSGIRRVNSVGSKGSQNVLPGTKSVTTSTSFINEDMLNRLAISPDYMCFEDSPDLVRSELLNLQIPEDMPPKRAPHWTPNITNENPSAVNYSYEQSSLDLELQEQFGRGYYPYEESQPNQNLPTHQEYYEMLNKVRRKLSEIQFHEESRQKLSQDSATEESKVKSTGQEQPPEWFTQYMSQFKRDLSKEVSNKVEEKLEDLMGGLNASEVEMKLRSLLGEYNSLAQERVICCCKVPGACTGKDLLETSFKNEQLTKSVCTDHSCQFRDVPVPLFEIPRKEGRNEVWSSLFNKEQDVVTTKKRSGRSRSKQDKKKKKADFVSIDAFLRTLHKREQELLKYMDKTNEKLKKKIEMKYNLQKAYSQFKDQDFAIQERERVLARIEGFRKRHNKTLAELGKLHKMMEGEQIKAIINENADLSGAAAKMDVSSEGWKGEREELEMLTSKDNSILIEYDAKFIKDCTVPDGSKLAPGERFVKEWLVKNDGTKRWTDKTSLCCTAHGFLIPGQTKIKCPALLPRQSGTLKLDFTAPEKKGWFTSTFRFRHGKHFFGDHIWVNIEVVDDPAVSAPSQRIIPRQISDPTSAIKQCITVSVTPPNPQDVPTEDGHQEGLVLNKEHLLGKNLFSVDEDGFHFNSQIPYNDAVSSNSPLTEVGVQVIKHVNYPSFSGVVPNEVFLKKWLVKNVGNEAWSNKVKLFNARFIPSGEPLVAKIPHILPGQMGIIELLLKAGNCEDRIYFSDFVLKSEGHYVKSLLSCSVHTFMLKPIPSDPHLEWQITMSDDTLMALHLARDTHLHYVPYYPTNQTEDTNSSSVSTFYKAYVCQCQDTKDEKRRYSCPNQTLNDSQEDAKSLDGLDKPDNDVDRASNVALLSGEEGCLSLDDDSDDGSLSEGEGDREAIEDPDALEVEDVNEDEGEVEEDEREIDEDPVESDDNSSDMSDNSDDDLPEEKPENLYYLPDVESEAEDDEDYYSSLKAMPLDLDAGPTKSIKEELEQQELISPLDPLEAAHVPEEQLKKEVSTLHQVFHQNVEINLDFDVLPKMAIKPNEFEERKDDQPPSDPLRFEEKHFMVSNLPPPPPPRAKQASTIGSCEPLDSDDESLDGMVFIGHNILNSPAIDDSVTEDSVSRDIAGALEEDDLLESSMTCSSFSELDTEDEKDDIEDGDVSSLVSENRDDGSPAEEESQFSNSSTSPEEVASVYYDTSHHSESVDIDAPTEPHQHPAPVQQRSTEQKSEHSLIEAGSSTPTLKEATTRSDSFEPLEVPLEGSSLKDQDSKDTELSR